jgi:DNA-binding transcriptional regulator YiaG
MRYEEKIDINHKLCPECLSENVETDHELVSLPIEEEWEETEYFLPVVHCNDCGESSKAFEAPQVTHGAVCKAMGLLSPWEIRNIRKELNIKIEDFAKSLGLISGSPIEAARIRLWEQGKEYPTKTESDTMSAVFFCAKTIKEVDGAHKRGNVTRTG